jgi:hypothetical protein
VTDEARDAYQHANMLKSIKINPTAKAPIKLKLKKDESMTGGKLVLKASKTSIKPDKTEGPPM